MSDPFAPRPQVPVQQPRPQAGGYGPSPWASQVVGGRVAQPPRPWGGAPSPVEPLAPIRTRWIVLGVVASVALIGLVATLGIVAAARQGSNRRVASAAGHRGQLRDYVVPAPAGAQPWSTEPSDQELDLAGAAKLNDSAVVDRRELLSRWGFVRGYVRRWRTDKAVMQVVLYQFPDEAAATGFARDDLSASLHDDHSSTPTGDWTALTPIDGTANGISMLLNKPYSTGDTGTLGVARVTDVVVAVLAVEAPPADVQLSNAVVLAQTKRL